MAYAIMPVGKNSKENFIATKNENPGAPISGIF